MATVGNEKHICHWTTEHVIEPGLVLDVIYVFLRTESSPMRRIAPLRRTQHRPCRGTAGLGTPRPGKGPRWSTCIHSDSRRDTSSLERTRETGAEVRRVSIQICCWQIRSQTTLAGRQHVLELSLGIFSPPNFFFYVVIKVYTFIFVLLSFVGFVFCHFPSFYI